MNPVILKETTVGELGGVSVGCGNFYVDEAYALPDGSTRVGRTATIAPFDREARIVVGEGSEVDVGGTRWRVTRVEKSGRLGTVTLIPAGAGPVIDGIDFGPAQDLRVLVARQLTGGSVGPIAPTDRTPIDWLERTWRALAGLDPAAAERLSRAMAHHLGSADPEIDGLILRFFSDLPSAPGGERAAELVREELDSYPADLPDPTPGNVTANLRESLLRVALRWGEGAAADAAVLAAAKAEVRLGDGAALIFDLARLDPAWARDELPASVALYPRDASTFLRVWTKLGWSADEALDRILPHADARGRDGLQDEIRWMFRSDAAQRDALLARL